MNLFIFIIGTVINFLICYTAYSKTVPNLTSLSGSILLFGCMMLVLVYVLWPKGKRTEHYWYPGQGMGYLSKAQTIVFLVWFLVGGAITTLLWLNNL